MYSDFDRDSGAAHPHAGGEQGMPFSRNVGRKATTFVNWAGAVTSVALIIGVGVWGYKLMVRDVSGVPVVAAIDGPMRVQPDNPGGREARHQGLAVNEVAALGTSAPPPDQLVLAPAPVDIEADDAVGVVLPVSGENIVNEEVPIEVSGQNAQLNVENVQDVSATPNAPATQAALEELVAAIGASTPALTATTPAVVTGGLGTSLRPKTRPAVIPASAPASQPNSVVTGAEIAPESIPAGTRLVQLGAFDSPDVARAEWRKLAKQFDGYLATKKRVVQRAESGGKIFYRLRAVGFEDLADARRFCTALVAENAACIPVVTR
ncbi:SPOR domain-containing protein [Nereida sp. MMG025]|uniref:SPOR domain-containing protein n=1 Tax=Nereida sp. MMG025 TaxID=2909981 RepID=UPI001F31DF5D|nr:SPOR domain-containing protein [Nereida sp. MMG025]MCF6443536.1 SPOR domain-containing protein [Nereida sp. MMG025]